MGSVSGICHLSFVIGHLSLVDGVEVDMVVHVSLFILFPSPSLDKSLLML